MKMCGPEPDGRAKAQLQTFSSQSLQRLQLELIYPLQYGFMQRSLIVAILVGLICAVTGSYLMVQRLALLGDAISHDGADCSHRCGEHESCRRHPGSVADHHARSDCLNNVR
jgi:hypothetical protein